MQILVIYTGGTIGCIGTPLAPMDGPRFEQAFDGLVTPVIQGKYPDCGFAFSAFHPTLDSTNIQPAEWCNIALRILDNYAAYDAFIVLHGTDSMVSTASALSFLLAGLTPGQAPLAALSKPVIVTGSQLPLFQHADGADGCEARPKLLFNADALQNVCGAVDAAHVGVAEVCLFFGSRLLRGNRCLKTSAEEFLAFSSPNYPPLGQIGIEFTQHTEAMLPPPPCPDLALDTQWPVAAALVRQMLPLMHLPGVMAFPAFPASSVEGGGQLPLIARLMQSCLAQGITGLVLESYGAGNFPSGHPENPAEGALYQILRQAHAAGVVIVNCTQALSGTVNGNAYAAGSWLGDCGVIGAYDMTSCTALVKLVCLQALNLVPGYGWPQRDIERLMMTPLAGEMMDVNRLDSRSHAFLAPGQSISTLDGSATLSNDRLLGPVLDGAGLEPPVRHCLLPDGVAAKAAMPGRLVMQADGNLVFRDRCNRVLFQTGSRQTGSRQTGARQTESSQTGDGQPAPSACALVLEGDAKTGVRLVLADLARNSTLALLYPLAQ